MRAWRRLDGPRPDARTAPNTRSMNLWFGIKALAPAACAKGMGFTVAYSIRARAMDRLPSRCMHKPLILPPPHRPNPMPISTKTRACASRGVPWANTEGHGPQVAH